MGQPAIEKAVVLVVMGPMGCGKTTIGRMLSERLGRPFHDADDFHPPENVVKMRAGIALNDADRFPWLDRLRNEIRSWLQRDESAVLACSGLKRAYRRRLGIDQESVISVYLKGPFELVQERIRQRKHRYMPDELLRSQFDALEEPRDGITTDISFPPEQVVTAIIDQLVGLPRP